MSRKYFFAVLMFFIIFLTFIACGVDRKNKNIEKDSDIPDQYKRIFDSLKFNIEHIKIDIDTDLYKSYAKVVEYNPQMIVHNFWGNDYQEDICKDEDGIIYLICGDKTLFLYKDEMIYLSHSELQSYIDKKLSFCKNDNDMSSIHSYTVFDRSLQEEKKRLENQIQKMGIQNLVLQKCYDFDSCKYWTGIQEYQEIPVFTTIYYEGINDEWMPIQVLNSLDGLEEMVVRYCFQFRKGEEKIKLLSFDKIAEALEYEYNMILTDNKYEVVEAELYFWINVNQEESEQNMEPVWILTVHEYCEGEEGYNEYQEMIHAQTGEHIEVRE